MDSRAESWCKQGGREPVCWESDPGLVPFPLETSSFAAAPVASTTWDQQENKQPGSGKTTRTFAGFSEVQKWNGRATKNSKNPE